MAKQEITYVDILAELRAKQYRPIYYLMGDEPYYIDLISNFLIEHVLTPEEQEFLRSTKALNEECTISIDTFTKDKKDVLDSIAELDEIMKKGDYVRWLTYVSKESKDYWMNAKRLKELEGRLPVKGLKLSGLRDYFKYIFIPARAGHTVDEIRYVSDTVVKAVQVKENHDVVYYTFEKIEGKWLLKLDTL